MYCESVFVLFYGLSMSIFIFIRGRREDVIYLIEWKWREVIKMSGEYLWMNSSGLMLMDKGPDWGSEG